MASSAIFDIVCNFSTRALRDTVTDSDTDRLTIQAMSIFKCGERLPELVVDLAGDGRAFVFAHRLDVGREGAELVFELAALDGDAGHVRGAVEDGGVVGAPGGALFADVEDEVAEVALVRRPEDRRGGVGTGGFSSRSPPGWARRARGSASPSSESAEMDGADGRRRVLLHGQDERAQDVGQGRPFGDHLQHPVLGVLELPRADRPGDVLDGDAHAVARQREPLDA